LATCSRRSRRSAKHLLAVLGMRRCGHQFQAAHSSHQPASHDKAPSPEQEQA
jgi:hypothetical protein